MVHDYQYIDTITSDKVLTAIPSAYYGSKVHSISHYLRYTNTNMQTVFSVGIMRISHLWVNVDMRLSFKHTNMCDLCLMVHIGKVMNQINREVYDERN